MVYWLPRAVCAEDLLLAREGGLWGQRGRRPPAAATRRLDSGKAGRTSARGHRDVWKTKLLKKNKRGLWGCPFRVLVGMVQLSGCPRINKPGVPVRRLSTRDPERHHKDLIIWGPGVHVIFFVVGFGPLLQGNTWTHIDPGTNGPGRAAQPLLFGHSWSWSFVACLFLGGAVPFFPKSCRVYGVSLSAQVSFWGLRSSFQGGFRKDSFFKSDRLVVWGIWVRVNIKTPRDRRCLSMFPFTRVPFWVPIFEPQPFEQRFLFK